MKPIKLPFDCIVGTQAEVVRNPFSGEAVTLTPEAVAVYDSIRGAEMIGNYKTVRKGLGWFMKHYPKAYMVLLD